MIEKIKMRDVVIGIAIIVIGVMQIHALNCGLNGSIYMTSMGVIGALAGYLFGKRGK